MKVQAQVVGQVKDQRRLGKPRENATVQVFLERDDSRRFQQYLNGTAVNRDGGVEVEIPRPGMYWLLATEETDWSYRRGACLVEVGEKGDYTFKALPNLAVGVKWGGPTKSKLCSHGNKVNLAVFRSKPSTSRAAKKIAVAASSRALRGQSHPTRMSSIIKRSRLAGR